MCFSVSGCYSELCLFKRVRASACEFKWLNWSRISQKVLVTFSLLNSGGHLFSFQPLKLLLVLGPVLSRGVVLVHHILLVDYQKVNNLFSLLFLQLTAL